MERKYSFRIGELAELFNISADSVRHYERMGLLHPKRNPDNNYRIYTLEDIRNMAMIRELLNLNFSLEEIKIFVEYRTVDSTYSMLNKELNAINASLAELFEKRISIESRLEALRKGKTVNNLEEVKEIEMNDRYCLLMSNSDNIKDYEVDYYLVKYMQSQRKKVDTIGACDCYTLKPVKYDDGSVKYETKNVFFYSSTIFYQSNYVLPAGKYLSLFYRGAFNKTDDLAKKLYDYAQKNGIEATGDLIELCHIDEYETSLQDEYLIELQLPVK